MHGNFKIYEAKLVQQFKNMVIEETYTYKDYTYLEAPKVWDETKHHKAHGNASSNEFERGIDF